MVELHPLLDVGANNFQVYYRAMPRLGVPDRQMCLFVHLDHPHNDMLELVAELGIPWILCAG